MYQEIDEEAKPVKDGLNNYNTFKDFIELGYDHQGFYKLYEGNQPRYTFRTYFNKYKDFSEVEKTFSKSFSKPLKRSYDYDLEIYEADEVKTFYDLIQLVSQRDGFKAYSYEYYNTVFNELKKDNLVKVFNAKINPSKLIKKFKEQIKNDHNEDRKKRTLKDIEFLSSLPNQKEYTCASLICTYTNSGAWSLYIGNDEAATYTGTVNRLYYEFIKDAYENKFEYADLFGVVGDPHTKFKNLAGIYEYKRKMGGDYIEFIGEFDLINKPFWYKVLPILLKIYRKIKK
jgi:lipid II:glycine glycyltransferase (peptidoglycan interpeptide bridge formation enzyme)